MACSMPRGIQPCLSNEKCEKREYEGKGVCVCVVNDFMTAFLFYVWEASGTLAEWNNKLNESSLYEIKEPYKKESDSVDVL